MRRPGTPDLKMYVSKQMKEALKKMPCTGREAHRSTFKALRKAGLVVLEPAESAREFPKEYRLTNEGRKIIRKIET
jgi:hypothetical protein